MSGRGRADAQLNYWIEEYKREQPESELLIVGNKVDVGKQEVPEDNIKKFAQAKNLQYCYCSAQSGQGVREAFERLASLILNNKALVEGLVEMNDDYVRGDETKKGRCC